MFSFRLLCYIWDKFYCFYNSIRQSVLWLHCSITSTTKLCGNKCVSQALIQVLLWTCAVGPCLYQTSASCISVLLPVFHCSCLAVNAHVWSGVGVQLWWVVPGPYSLCSWVQPASTFIYKHATCHHNMWLYWMALMYVTTMLHCAQYYCCLLCTIGMNLAAWLCYITELCIARAVCSSNGVLCVKVMLTVLNGSVWHFAVLLHPCKVMSGLCAVRCQAGLGECGGLLASLMGTCRIDVM